MPPATYVVHPVEGDYILSFTGLSWNILRRTGHDSAMSISTGDTNRKTALARIRSLTETGSSRRLGSRRSRPVSPDHALQEISRLIS